MNEALLGEIVRLLGYVLFAAGRRFAQVNWLRVKAPEALNYGLSSTIGPVP